MGELDEEQKLLRATIKFHKSLLEFEVYLSPSVCLFEKETVKYLEQIKKE